MPTVTVPQAFDLASQHHQAGRLADAEALYREILTVQPDHAGALHFLGVVSHQTGQVDRAVELIRRAIQLVPHDAAAYSNLGIVMADRGDLDEAIRAYRQAIALEPDAPESYNNLGNAFLQRGQLEEAVAALWRAIAIKPDYADAHYNLGNTLLARGELDEALAETQQAIQLKPDYADAHHNMGNILRGQGRLDEAIAAYRRALEFHPRDAGIHSSLILTLHFLADHGGEVVAREQERWNRQFAAPAGSGLRHFANDRDPRRRLRVGYVSADFENHPVAWNLMPLFERHDDENFEIVCYSAVARPDEITDRFKERASLWRRTVGISDEALAEMIRRDRVDILVDLSQHAAGNRLPLFARRPAPVQVSFAGYPESTGVGAIGYRISDRWLEECRIPNAECQNEQVFLTDSFWCYDPGGIELAVSELPARANGYITFGSLNNFCKVNEPLLQLWARVLRQVPHSRLLILGGLGVHRGRTLEILEREEVAAPRVEFVQRCPRQEYVATYQRLDIVLDPFPYNGHTTSLDALWMGVPVVSLAGERAVSRGGLSQLSNLGLAELVAPSEDGYVDIAVRLANDLPKVGELRRTLRARMEASVLMDAPRFARNIEAAYRAMWRQWCEEGTGP